MVFGILLAAVVAWPALAAAPSDTPDPQLRFIDQLYREGERYRAESEILRFLHDAPAHPRRAGAALARAKLYYREGRYREAELMLYSLLDRYPRDEAAPDAAHLLAYTQLMQGRPVEAAETLRRAGADPVTLGQLAALAEPAPDAVDPGTAVTWSTVLPGAGFFVLGEPAKATAALSLNALFLAGAVIAYQQENYGAALALALVEIALYTGGREAVRQEAEARRARQERLRRESWLATQDAPALLAVGIRFDFAGR
jgi:tetratricopeptide (TPR) repeat protein